MTSKVTRNVGASLLAIFGCVALLIYEFVDPFDPRPGRPSQSSRSRRRPGPAPDDPALDGEAREGPSSRRRLSAPDDEEAERERQVVSYLGGLSPATDQEGLPLFLRDSSETTSLRTIYDWRERDVAFFWHIPRAGGSTMKNIVNFCFDMRRAEKLEDQPSMEFVRDNILNMDTSSPEGLSDAFAQQLVNSDSVDIIVSNYFLAGAALFTELHYGRAFTILRHPVDLALSLFLYRRNDRPYWQKITFHDYVDSDRYMDNWMVRQLTGTSPWEALDETHLERAKLVVGRKVFVGLLDHVDETVRQLRAHYGWEERGPRCIHNHLSSGQVRVNENEHAGLQGGRGGRTWKVLTEKDRWDMALYHFGLELFSLQRERYPPQT